MCKNIVEILPVLFFSRSRSRQKKTGAVKTDRLSHTGHTCWIVVVPGSNTLRGGWAHIVLFATSFRDHKKNILLMLSAYLYLSV